MVATACHRPWKKLTTKDTFKTSHSFQASCCAAPYEVNSGYFGSTKAMVTFTAVQFLLLQSWSLPAGEVTGPRVCTSVRAFLRQRLLAVCSSSSFTMDDRPWNILLYRIILYRIVLYLSYSSLMFYWVLKHLESSARGWTVLELVYTLSLCLKVPQCVSWGRDFIVS